MTNLNRFTFGGRYAVAWPTLALYIGPLIMFNLVFDRERVQGSPLWAVGYTVIVAISGLIPLVLARYTLLPVTERPTRPLITITVWLLSGAARAVTIALLTSETITASAFFSRFLGATIGTALLLSIAELVVTLFASWRSQSQELAVEVSLLKNNIKELDQVASSDRAELLSHAKKIIESELSSVSQRLTGSQAQSQLVNEIQKFAEEILRPLTYRISELPMQSIEIASARQLPFRTYLLQRISVSNLIRPTWNVAMLASIAAVARLVGQDNQLPLLGSIPAIGATWAVWLLFHQLSQRLNTYLFVAFIITVGSGFIAGLVGATVERSFSTTAPSIQFWFFLIGVWAVTVINATVSAVGLLSQRFLEEQRNLTQVLAGQHQRTRQELWLNRKRLAAGLHGPVQAALQVSVMKLKFGNPDDLPSFEDITIAVATALRHLEDAPGTNIDDMYATFNELRTVWAHQSTMTLHIDAAAEKCLATDPTVCETLTELLTEAVLNAMKHGEATWIDAKCRADEDHLELIVRNNGKPLPVGRKPGYGSAALNELCAEWSLTNNSEFTELTAVLAPSSLALK